MTVLHFAGVVVTTAASFTPIAWSTAAVVGAVGAVYSYKRQKKHRRAIQSPREGLWTSDFDLYEQVQSTESQNVIAMDNYRRPGATTPRRGAQATPVHEQTEDHHRREGFVIDGSNAAYDQQGEPSLTTLLRVEKTIRSRYPSATITVFVDANFRFKLPAKERTRYERAFKGKSIFECPGGQDCDDYILAFAKSHNRIVISNDHFRDKPARAGVPRLPFMHVAEVTLIGETASIPTPKDASEDVERLVTELLA